MKTRGPAVLALVALLAGCGGTTSDERADERPRPEPVQEERLKEEAPASEAPTDDPVAEEDAGDPASDVVSSAALDAYVAAERAAMEGMPGLELYTSAEVEAVYPSTIRFSYVYADPIDPAAAAAYFDTMASTFAELCDSVIFPAMTRAGVVDPAVTYAYFNADGSLIWEQTLTDG